MLQSPKQTQNSKQIRNELINTKSKPSFFENLPNELLVLIFAFVGLPGLEIASKVCKRWRKILDHEDVWKYSILNNWGWIPAYTPEISWKQEFIRLTREEALWKDGAIKRSAWTPGIGELDPFFHVDFAGDVIYCSSKPNNYVCEIRENKKSLLASNNLMSPDWTYAKSGVIFSGAHNQIQALHKKESSKKWHRINFTTKSPVLHEKSAYDDTYQLASFLDHQNLMTIVSLQSGIQKEFDLGSFGQVTSCMTDSLITSYFTTDEEIIYLKDDNEPVRIKYDHSKILSQSRSRILTYRNGEFILWEKETLRACHVFQLKEEMSSFDWKHESNLLVAGTAGGKIHVWFYGPKLEYSRMAHPNRVCSVKVDSFKLVSYGEDGSAKVWNSMNGMLLTSLKSENPRKNTTFKDMQIGKNKIWLCLSDAVIVYLAKEKVNKSKAVAKGRKQLKLETTYKPKTVGYKYDITEEMNDYAFSKNYEAITRTKIQKHMIEGLNEEEQIQYALLVSMDTSKVHQETNWLSEYSEDAQFELALKRSQVMY